MSERTPRRFSRRELIEGLPRRLRDPLNALPLGLGGTVILLAACGVLSELRRKDPLVELAYGGFTIKPNNPELQFRTTTETMLQGIPLDNVISHDRIYLEGSKKRPLSQVSSFHVNSVRLMRGEVVGDSDYWIQFPRIPVWDGETNRTKEQILYVSLSSQTIPNITPDFNTKIVLGTVNETGYYVGTTKIAGPGEIGRISKVE